MSATVLAFDPRAARAEDVLNCQGLSFELWLSRVEAIIGRGFNVDAAWSAWEHGVSAADYALHVEALEGAN
jgi:hypothetical protein